MNLGVTNARDTGDVVTTGFGISIDLPVFDRNQGVIAQETANTSYAIRRIRQSVLSGSHRHRHAVNADRVVESPNCNGRSAEAKQRLLVDTYRAAVDRDKPT